MLQRQRRRRRHRLAKCIPVFCFFACWYYFCRPACVPACVSACFCLAAKPASLLAYLLCLLACLLTHLVACLLACLPVCHGVWACFFVFIRWCVCRVLACFRSCWSCLLAIWPGGLASQFACLLLAWWPDAFAPQFPCDLCARVLYLNPTDLPACLPACHDVFVGGDPKKKCSVQLTASTADLVPCPCCRYIRVLAWMCTCMTPIRSTCLQLTYWCYV